MLREKWRCPGRRDATTKRSRRVVSARRGKKYLKFSPEVLSSFRPAVEAGAPRVWVAADVIEVEKGRLENAALSLRPP